MLADPLKDPLQDLRQDPATDRGTTLSEIRVGAAAVVTSLDLEGAVCDHLMHLGFLPDASIAVLRRAPAGDPTVYRIEGAEIALRRETAIHIRVRPQSSAEAKATV